MHSTALMVFKNNIDRPDVIHCTDETDLCDLDIRKDKGCLVTCQLLTKGGWGRVKFNPRTYHESIEAEFRYSSTLSSTSALGGVGGKCHAPAALTTGKRLQKIGWAPVPLWMGQESFAPIGVSIPGPSVTQRVRIPTALSWPTIHVIYVMHNIYIQGYSK